MNTTATVELHVTGQYSKGLQCQHEHHSYMEHHRLQWNSMSQVSTLKAYSANMNTTATVELHVTGQYS